MVTTEDFFLHTLFFLHINYVNNNFQNKTQEHINYVLSLVS